MESMFVWHHLYVNPAPVHRDVRQFQSHDALPCYPLTGVSSVRLLWFLIQAGLLPRISEQMPPPYLKSHHSAQLMHVASDNTAAVSCCPSSVLASENNFPIIFLVTWRSFTAENLGWMGRTGMQCSELAPLLAVSPVWSYEGAETSPCVALSPGGFWRAPSSALCSSISS